MSRDEHAHLRAGARRNAQPGAVAFTADLAIVGTAEVNLIWRGAGGKTVKSIPAEVNRDHPEQLKALQRVQKDLEKMLPAHARRLERMLIERRQWPVALWRERYFDHPLLGQLNRRLIWESLGKIPQLGAFHEGKFVSSDGSSVNFLEDGQIRLWHPIDSPPNVVLAWRQWLEQNRLTQPFKQAHREIYILTDAERQTVTYSTALPPMYCDSINSMHYARPADGNTG